MLGPLGTSRIAYNGNRSIILPLRTEITDLFTRSVTLNFNNHLNYFSAVNMKQLLFCGT